MPFPWSNEEFVAITHTVETHIVQLSPRFFLSIPSHYLSRPVGKKDMKTNINLGLNIKMYMDDTIVLGERTVLCVQATRPHRDNEFSQHFVIYGRTF